VIDNAFEVDPWCIRESRLDLDVLAHTESVFALSNGHIGMRGNLDEGEPAGLPGMYLNSVYELRPLPYAEAGYGYPEAFAAWLRLAALLPGSAAPLVAGPNGGGGHAA